MSFLKSFSKSIYFSYGMRLGAGGLTLEVMGPLSAKLLASFFLKAALEPSIGEGSIFGGRIEVKKISKMNK